MISMIDSSGPCAWSSARRCGTGRTAGSARGTSAADDLLLRVVLAGGRGLTQLAEAGLLDVLHQLRSDQGDHPGTGSVGVTQRAERAPAQAPVSGTLDVLGPPGPGHGSQQDRRAGPARPARHDRPVPGPPRRIHRRYNHQRPHRSLPYRAPRHRLRCPAQGGALWFRLHSEDLRVLQR